MDHLKKIIGDYQSFLRDVLDEVKAEGFDMGDFVQLDHICYRTESREAYDNKKQELTSSANLLGETMVNGRPIATFRLHQPIVVDGWRIDSLELPAPKEGSHYPEGLEHIEFVLYDDLPSFLQKYPDKEFDLKSVNRGINPEAGYKIGNYSVKFHLLNLPTVINLERKLGIAEVNDVKEGQT